MIDSRPSGRLARCRLAPFALAIIAVSGIQHPAAGEVLFTALARFGPGGPEVVDSGASGAAAALSAMPSPNVEATAESISSPSLFSTKATARNAGLTTTEAEARVSGVLITISNFSQLPTGGSAAVQAFLQIPISFSLDVNQMVGFGGDGSARVDISASATSRSGDGESGHASLNGAATFVVNRFRRDWDTFGVLAGAPEGGGSAVIGLPLTIFPGATSDTNLVTFAMSMQSRSLGAGPEGFAVAQMQGLLNWQAEILLTDGSSIEDYGASIEVMPDIPAPPVALIIVAFSCHKRSLRSRNH